MLKLKKEGVFRVLAGNILKKINNSAYQPHFLLDMGICWNYCYI